jgi:pilus assembly protein CpaB
MRGKAIIPLVLGLCVGLLAVKFGVDAIKRARGSVEAQATVEVARAKLDIDAFEEITPEMVELVEVPDSAFIPAQDRVTQLDDLVGRVTAKAIPSQAPVLLSMLAPPGTPAGMVGRIPPGYRAVSVRIDEVTGVAYQIKPGDFVDVIVVMDVDTGNRQRRRETIAEVVLENIEVAAIGQETAATGNPNPGQKTRPAMSATLLIPEEEVPKLHLAATRGKITLAMRGDADAIVKGKNLSYVRDSDVFAALRDEHGDDKAKPPVPVVVVKPVDSEPEPEPYAVLVRRGSTVPDVRPAVERIVFESADSPNIVGVSEGLAGPQADRFRPKRHDVPSLRGGQKSDVPDRTDRRSDDDQEPNDSE